MIIGLDAAYKGFSIFDIDQFKLDKDELARVCMFDPEFTISWAHWLQFGAKDTKDSRNGYYKCLGRYEVIFGVPGSGRPGQGADPDQCDACRVQIKNGAVGLVARRFATNIMRYLTDNKGTPRTPLQFDCLVWRFGDDKYNRLLEIKKQYGQTDHGLRVIDLMIKCEVGQYQRYQIDPLRGCLWQEGGQEVAAKFTAIWQKNRQPELEDLLGTRVEKVVFQQLVSAATGTHVGGVAGGQQPMTSPKDLQSLLDGGFTLPPAAPAPVASFAPAPVASFAPAPVAYVPATAQQVMAPVAAYQPPPPPPAGIVMAPPPGYAAPAPAQPAPQVVAPANFDDLLRM